MTADVVVIGSGFAGLSAAVRVAESGLKVVVAEEAPRLGGRATAFADRQTNERVDNGQHVLFGCYRETFEFLRRIGSAHLAPIERRLELTMAGDGRTSALVCPGLPPPWHLIAGLLRWRALSLGDRLSARKIASVLRAARSRGAAAVAAEVAPDQTVSTWLAARGQSRRLCDWLWHPLAIAALNQSPDTAAARPFVRVLCELFGPRPEDSAIALPRVPLDELYADPAVKFIERHGGSVHLESPARVDVDSSGAIAGVDVGHVQVKPQTVISAVPWHAFGRIWKNGVPPALERIAASAQRMTPSPIVTVNLWFDRPVLRGRFVGFVRGKMHWAFDKSVVFGQGASHISVVASGADDLLRCDNAQLAAIACKDIQSAFPEALSARLLRSVAVREPRATFSLRPGEPTRPGTATALPCFFLAGDWTDTELPATIEGAVLSGHRAAAAVLSMRQ